MLKSHQRAQTKRPSIKVLCSKHHLAGNPRNSLTLATCSSQRPREMNTRSMGGVSKKVIGEYGSLIAIAAITTATEYAYETAIRSEVQRESARVTK